MLESTGSVKNISKMKCEMETLHGRGGEKKTCADSEALT